MQPASLPGSNKPDRTVASDPHKPFVNAAFVRRLAKEQLADT
jgi:hypothetical protein